jgi:hypothetical protein
MAMRSAEAGSPEPAAPLSHLPPWGPAGSFSMGHEVVRPGGANRSSAPRPAPAGTRRGVQRPFETVFPEGRQGSIGSVAQLPGEDPSGEPAPGTCMPRRPRA